MDRAVTPEREAATLTLSKATHHEMSANHVVGLISDTHGLLRPEALHALEGSDLILHAGDIGNPNILTELGRLAPVTAIRGNVDNGAWSKSIPETEVVAIGVSTLLYMLHNVDDLDLNPAAAGFQAVISGHSHRAGFHRKDGVLYMNPGSAGPRRFSLPITVGRLIVDADELSVTITELDLRS